jgi:hypothetical protein
MSAYDPPSRGGGRTAAAVLLAVAVLAVLGGVFGYVLGTKANEAKATTSGSPTPAASRPRTTAQPTKSAGGIPCPDFMQEAAAKRGAPRPLTLRLYIATEKSEVWVCAAANGALWYQGHAIRKGKFPDETPVEGENGLLLRNVNGIDQNRYQAVNEDQGGRTTYTVSRTELIIDRNGNKSTEKVVNSSPPP